MVSTSYLKFIPTLLLNELCPVGRSPDVSEDLREEYTDHRVDSPQSRAPSGAKNPGSFDHLTKMLEGLRRRISSQGPKNEKNSEHASKRYTLKSVSGAFKPMYIRARSRCSVVQVKKQMRQLRALIVVRRNS